MRIPTSEAVEKELKREKYRVKYKSVIKSTVYTLIVVAAIAVLVATLVLPVLQISGECMEPSLSNGEIVVLVKTKKFERGDLCAFYYSNKILIKRVVGLPGDVIVIDDEGTVFVNNVPLDEPYITAKVLEECDIEFPYQVPEEQLFVLGDKRESSIDSRSTVIGCIARENILGRIFFKIWPFEKITFID
jgi:signal peptidase I